MKNVDAAALTEALEVLRKRALGKMSFFARRRDAAQVDDWGFTFIGAFDMLHFSGVVTRKEYLSLYREWISEWAKFAKEAKERVPDWECPSCFRKIAGAHPTTPNGWEWKYCPFCGARI